MSLKIMTNAYERRRCEGCIFHFLSMEIEENPDNGFIQKVFCDYCGGEHFNWKWVGDFYSRAFTEADIIEEKKKEGIIEELDRIMAVKAKE